MRPYFNRKKLFLIPFGIAAFVALAGFVVMSLWNVLMPVIFHLGVITFWQALGLFVLAKILFGFGKGGHMRGGAPWMRNRMEDRFGNMSPEEREKFRERWAQKCGHGRWGRHADGPPFGRGWDKTEPAPEKSPE
jgi:hypothetical protein